MASSKERAWLSAHQKGSKALVQRLDKVHANNPEYQAFKKKHGLGDTSSVKQVSKSTVDAKKEKARQVLAGKAYGATKGTRMGSAEGTGETLRDTIAPLTRDQHSAVKAAEREAKAAEKPSKPKKEKAAAPAPEKKKPTALELIAAAAAKRKLNQPPVSPKALRRIAAVGDMEHDHGGFEDLGDTQYGGRHSYNEEAELDEVAKWRTNPKAHDVDTDGSFLTKNSGDFDNLKARETYLSNAKTYINNKIKNAKNARKQTQSYVKSAIKLYPQKEEVEQVDEASETEYSPHAHSGYSRAIKPGTKIGIHQRPRGGKLGLGKINPAEVTEYHGQDERGQHMYTVKQGNRTRNITSRSALIRTIKKPSVTKEEVEQIDEAQPKNLKGTPVVSLADVSKPSDFRKDKYGRTVPKKLAANDPRVKFHKEETEQIDEMRYGIGTVVKLKKPIDGHGYATVKGFTSSGSTRGPTGRGVPMPAGNVKKVKVALRKSDDHSYYAGPITHIEHGDVHSVIRESAPGWMLKQDPELAKKVEAKKKLAKKRQKQMGNPEPVKEAKHHMGGALFADTAARLQKAINAHKERMDQATNGPEHEYHHPTLDIKTKSRLKLPAPWAKVEDK